MRHPDVNEALQRKPMPMPEAMLERPTPPARVITRTKEWVMLELDHIRVGDVMHYGILSCRGEATLQEVAEIMATRHVHAVAITNGDGARPVGVVSDVDIAAAIASGNHPNTAQAAATEPLAVSSDERLTWAAQLMTDGGATHLVVADAADGQPIGVLSTLDMAAVYAHENRWPRSSTNHRSASDYGRVWAVE